MAEMSTFLWEALIRSKTFDEPQVRQTQKGQLQTLPSYTVESQRQIILKATGEKLPMQKGTTIKLTVNFSLETMEAKTQ